MTTPDAHILIVDDYERIRSLLGRFLRKSGYMVSMARDAAQARRLLAGLEFDLIVLDVMMPGEDGLSLTRDLRKLLDTPILLLTAKGDIEDRISGLESGADDYLPKPFEPRELILRLSNIIKRRNEAGGRAQSHDTVTFGPFAYRIDRGELRRADELIRITEREREILGQIASGATNREIAERLFLSPWTVKEYSGTLYRKLGVRNRTEAVQRAQRLGLL